MKLCPPAKSNVRFDLMRHSMDTSLGYLLSRYQSRFESNLFLSLLR